MQSQELTQDQKEALLTERELREYQIYLRLNRPPMAVTAAEAFFQVFLQGHNCEEIHRLNPNGFSLGAIVRTRVECNWDQRRRDHQELLAARARERVQQITLETIERIANEVAASNKLVNDKVLRYLQTGNESELAGTNIGGLKHLKEMIDMLQKLTGQDAKKNQTQIGGTVEHRHVVEAATPTVLPSLPADKRVPPQLAASALDAIHKSRGGR